MIAAEDVFVVEGEERGEEKPTEEGREERTVGGEEGVGGGHCGGGGGGREREFSAAVWKVVQYVVESVEDENLGSRSGSSSKELPDLFFSGVGTV